MIQLDEHIQLPTSYIKIYQLQKIQTGPSIEWQPVLGNPPKKKSTLVAKSESVNLRMYTDL